MFDFTEIGGVYIQYLDTSMYNSFIIKLIIMDLTGGPDVII